MPAYLIVIRNDPVSDPAEMAEYQRKTRETSPSVNVKPLIVYGGIQGLEGAAPDAVVMLQFETVEDAQAWYNSPGYQAALPHRLNAGNYRSFIVEGL